MEITGIWHDEMRAYRESLSPDPMQGYVPQGSYVGERQPNAKKLAKRRAANKVARKQRRKR